MTKFGPSRKELRFRLIAGLSGVVLTICAAMYVHRTSGAHLGELLVFGLGFFGGTALWSGWKLRTKDKFQPPD